MTLLKCCTKHINKFGKLSSGHRTGRGQFSFQSQRRAMPKSIRTTAQLCSFHMLAKLGLVVCELRTSRCTSWIYKRQRNQRSNCQHPLDHIKRKAREFQKKKIISASLTSLKPLTMCITTNCGKLLKRWEYQTILPEKYVCRSRSKS